MSDHGEHGEEASQAPLSARMAHEMYNVHDLGRAAAACLCGGEVRLRFARLLVAFSAGERGHPAGSGVRSDGAAPVHGDRPG